MDLPRHAFIFRMEVPICCHCRATEADADPTGCAARAKWEAEHPPAGRGGWRRDASGGWARAPKRAA